MNKFSNYTIEHIGYYVYRLIDPRNGETFYVGKGKGNRVFEHVKGTLKNNLKSDKIDRINKIKALGLEIIYIIQRWGLTEEESFLVESSVIDCFPGLTNIQRGYDIEHGITNAITLEERFSLETYEEPDFNYILIKIKQSKIEELSDKDDPVYEAVRYCWKLNIDRAKKCPYVFAIVDGIVKGVFKVNEWRYVIDDNEKGRIEFVGEREENLELIYKNQKRIPDYYIKKGQANPAMYGINNKI